MLSLVRRGWITALVTCTFSVQMLASDRNVSIDFETSEGFSFGSSIESYAGWNASQMDVAFVTDENPFTGAQSLVIEASTPPTEVEYQMGELVKGEIRFIQFSVKPTLVSSEEVTLSLHFGGSDIGLKLDDENIQIVVPEPNGMQGRMISTAIAVGEDGMSEQWLNFVVRQNLAHGAWDLFVNGELVEVNLEMADEGSWDYLAFNGSGEGETFVDAVSIGSENPLFQDSDGDGMPDAYEVAYRLDPHRDDRNEDRDGDGITNISEYLSRTSPSRIGQGEGDQVLYVDNLNGSDSNSGLHPYSGGANGPKASIKAAMLAAQSGAVIVVMPGTGVYQEGSRSAKGKRITIRSVGPIVIK